VSPIGERNVDALFGAITGFTDLGFSNGPKSHSSLCARAGAGSERLSSRRKPTVRLGIGNRELGIGQLQRREREREKKMGIDNP